LDLILPDLTAAFCAKDTAGKQKQIAVKKSKSNPYTGTCILIFDFMQAIR
jgi:hypothetical protein